MARASATRVRIGISGWNYSPWRGVFYPRGLAHARELAYASRVFSTVEVNGSFYSLQRPSTYQHWYAETPPDFVFALKGSRYITHLLRLKNVEQALANFFASGVLGLGEKLGPILWQLPPQTKYDPERLAAFFELLPRTLGEAARLARGHDARLFGRSLVTVPRALASQPVRHALEVRHESFCEREYVRQLRRYGIANCIADSAGLYPCFGDVTSDFVYVRLHGSTELYSSGYTARELATWAARVRAWSSGEDAPAPARLDRAAKAARPRPRDVFVYFDNDAKVRAPFDARNLARLLERKRIRAAPEGVPEALDPPGAELLALVERAARAAGVRSSRATAPSSRTGQRSI